LPFLIVGFITLSMCVLLICLGVHFQKKSNEKYRYADMHFTKTEGKIVETETKYDSRTNEPTVYIDIVIEYLSEKGERFCFVPKISFGNLDFRVGDTINLLYNPDNPEEVLIDLKRIRFFPSILCGAFAAGCLLASFIMFIFYFFNLISGGFYFK